MAWKRVLRSTAKTLFVKVLAVFAANLLSSATGEEVEVGGMLPASSGAAKHRNILPS